MRLHEFYGEEDGETILNVMERKFGTDCGVSARDFLVALLDDWQRFLGGRLYAQIVRMPASPSVITVEAHRDGAIVATGDVWRTGEGWL